MPASDKSHSRRLPAALFAIAIGIAMIAMWSVSLLTGAMPELHDAPWTAIAHLAAEFTTAGVLIASGAGLLARRPWARPLHLAAMGMLLYAVVQASGYFVQQGQPAMSALFALLAVLAALNIGVTARLDRAAPASAK